MLFFVGVALIDADPDSSMKIPLAYRWLAWLVRRLLLVVDILVVDKVYRDPILVQVFRAVNTVQNLRFEVFKLALPAFSTSAFSLKCCRVGAPAGAAAAR